MFLIPKFASGGNFAQLRGSRGSFYDVHSAGYLRLSHEYRAIKDISLMYCLMQAHLDSHCQAVSYSERFRYCELNDKSGLFDEVNSAVKDGWKTYNIINEAAGEGTGM